MREKKGMRHVQTGKRTKQRDVAHWEARTGEGKRKEERGFGNKVGWVENHSKKTNCASKHPKAIPKPEKCGIEGRKKVHSTPGEQKTLRAHRVEKCGTCSDFGS